MLKISNRWILTLFFLHSLAKQWTAWQLALPSKSSHHWCMFHQHVSHIQHDVWQVHCWKKNNSIRTQATNHPTPFVCLLFLLVFLCKQKWLNSNRHMMTSITHANLHMIFHLTYLISLPAGLQNLAWGLFGWLSLLWFQGRRSLLHFGGESQHGAFKGFP